MIIIIIKLRSGGQGRNPLLLYSLSLLQAVDPSGEGSATRVLLLYCLVLNELEAI